MVMYIVVGAILIFGGLLIHKFKMYFLMSGYNTMTKREKENVDVVNLARYFGYTMYFLGAGWIVAGVLEKMIPNIVVYLVIGTAVFLIYRIYKMQKFDNNQIDKAEAIATGFLVGIPMLIAVIMMTSSMGAIEINTNTEGLVFDGKVIDTDEIESMKMIEETPSMKKVFGSGIGTNRKGTFNVEGYGECKVYTNLSKGDTIVLTTKEGVTYIINSDNSESVKDAYETMSKKVS
ncbi:MAG: DUF3784 domain-containing protein [Sarcina sp.]